jgi:hypothetical protein
MSDRPSRRQQIIERLKAMQAPAGCTVTPAKQLVDAKLQIAREVAVVVEATVDGHLFTLSYEIADQDEPADLPWVEGMLQKHRTLPTPRSW